MRRIPRSRGFGRRGWAAIGLGALVILVSAGAYLAYQNTLPTTVASNYTNGQKDVPTDTRVLLTFSRSVGLAAVNSGFSISPPAVGSIAAVSGDTQYAWTPAQPLADLTTYTVTLKAITDTSRHQVRAAHWTFTTKIVPRVTAVTGPDGKALTDGAEIDPGTVLKLSFNDAMEPITIKVSLGASIANLKWAADDRSASFTTAGIPSGPLVVNIEPGGRDQTGHLVPAAFNLKTGIYYHDTQPTTPLPYPALIQIPNDQLAVDQNGLQAADVVFEYLAEGGITRLTAIYQNAPATIGPMRSSRFISLKIARHYEGLLFQSGESQATASRAAQDPVPQFFDTVGYQYRTDSRYAPDNLMMSGASVLAAENNFFSGIPAFKLPKARPSLTGGTATTSISVTEHYSVYTYDPVNGTYQKNESDHAYQDVNLGQPLHIEMLIVFHTQEQLLNVGDGHGAHIHDFDLDTNGNVEIYYKGMAYSGTWASTDSHGPLTFTVGGQQVSLPPGLVWIDVTA
jgi:Protein of unknown function (DUF3048) N-terminal domain/Protein of unknown function (DUF3048) C-terminal domain/Bacterial Ig-like domain